MRGLVVTALAALVSACGGGAVAPTPASPAPTPSEVRITQQDNGKTVDARVGDRVSLELGDRFEWTLDLPDPNVLAPEPGALPRGTQLVARAKRPGNATIGGTGRPRCAPNEACIQIIATFIVTVAVR